MIRTIKTYLDWLTVRPYVQSDIPVHQFHSSAPAQTALFFRRTPPEYTACGTCASGHGRCFGCGCLCDCYRNFPNIIIIIGIRQRTFNCFLYQSRTKHTDLITVDAFDYPNRYHPLLNFITYALASPSPEHSLYTLMSLVPHLFAPRCKGMMLSSCWPGYVRFARFRFPKSA